MDALGNFWRCGRLALACPFFVPVEKLENGTWLHATRLPLGCGWSGLCTAPGHEDETPSHDDLQQFCNLGYAQGCGRLPKDREWDSIRFGARTLGADKQNGTGSRIQVRYVCERDHRPVEQGMLEFDAAGNRQEPRHHDARLQRMAECFVESYLEKRKRRGTTTAIAS
ncbi:MAG: hypothetical protein ABR880_14390 [Candidatus Sulfotelmatobacter sp.]|jgi:hypothetical protein